MHQLYYIEHDAIEAADSLCIYTQIKSIPTYLQLLCNAHHLLDPSAKIPYKPLMLTGSYTQWVIGGELNYQYVLLSLLQMLNRYSAFSGREHACRELVTSVLHPPEDMEEIWTEPPVYSLPIAVRESFDADSRDYSLYCHRQAYVEKLSEFFTKPDRYLDFWDSIPTWMPFTQVEAREQKVRHYEKYSKEAQNVRYTRSLASLGVVSAKGATLQTYKEAIKMSEIEPYENDEVPVNDPSLGQGD